MLLTSYSAFAVQVIHSSSPNRTAAQTAELNRLEEQQELLRKQVRLQEESLRVQKQQLQEQQKCGYSGYNGYTGYRR
jgi:ERCC4-type nuclease